MRKIDLTGRRFGKLVVQGRHPTSYRSPGGYTCPRWICRCDCGGEIVPITKTLRSGDAISCGCERKKRQLAAVTKHGDATKRKGRTSEYRAWEGMKDRCLNPNYANFKDYGGRGIQVCDRWRDSFVNFLEDMGRKPSPNHQIGRKDNDGPYSPDNCRWVTVKEQANNRRTPSARNRSESIA